MYTICSKSGNGPGGGGGGSNDDPDPNCSSAKETVEGESSSENLDSFIGAETNNTRPAVYRWIPFKHKFGIWRFISTEDAIHEKINNNWQFKTFTHRNILKDGEFLGIVASLSIDNIQIIKTTTQAAIRYDIHFEASAVCKGFPIESNKNTFASSPTFTLSNGSSH